MQVPTVKPSNINRVVLHVWSTASRRLHCVALCALHKLFRQLRRSNQRNVGRRHSEEAARVPRVAPFHCRPECVLTFSSSPTGDARLVSLRWSQPDP